MNILILNLYSGHIERGAETFTDQLAQRLSQKHSVTFVKGGSKVTPESQFSSRLIANIRKRLFIDPAGLAVLAFSLAQIPKLLGNNWQVVLPLNGFWQLLVVKLCQIFKGYQIIVTGHSGPGWDERWNLYLTPSVFVATTKPSHDWAQKTAPWVKVALIPLAIDLDTWLVPPKPLKLPRPIFLCPAALVSYKRIDLAIKAVAKLDQGSLVVLGTGPLKRRLSQLGNELLGSRFLLTQVKHQDIPQWYQACDVVTLPSDPQENSPMVFLEAMAAGKMVVTTDSPRNRWILGNIGIFCEPRNTYEYAKALKQALMTKSINNSIEVSKYSWNSVVKKYEQLFRYS